MKFKKKTPIPDENTEIPIPHSSTDDQVDLMNTGFNPVVISPSDSDAHADAQLKSQLSKPHTPTKSSKHEDVEDKKHVQNVPSRQNLSDELNEDDGSIPVLVEVDKRPSMCEVGYEYIDMNYIHIYLYSS